jgi:FeS assembly protein IscX
MASHHDHDRLGWLDTDEIAERLLQAHPGVDPLSLRFTALRALVERLPGFTPDPDHPVNERILETIQSEWYELRLDAPGDDDDDED